MNRFNQLAQQVEQWAQDRGIFEKGTPIAQADKTIEEANEIKTAILNNDKAEIMDGIGDTLVTLIIQAKMQNVSILNCLESAYHTIATRTGKMINGTFVKNDISIPVILHQDDYVIVKQDGDFVRFNDGQIVIYRDWREGLKDLSKNEKLVCCLALSDQQKEAVKESIRKYEKRI